jgi:hypothetical protein
MIRGAAATVGVVLVVIAAGFVAQRLFGSSDSDQFMKEAQEAINALPYRSTMDEVSEGVLVGTAYGHDGIAVRFVVTDEKPGRGEDIPPRLIGPNWSSAESGKYGVSTSPYGTGASHAERVEKVDVSSAIEEALCRKSIGEACPP